MPALKLFVFGPPRLIRGSDPLDISLRKDLALFVYLAVTRQPHSRDALATLLWPDSDQQVGRSNLRRALYRLNKKLQSDVLRATNKIVEIDPDAGLWVDVEAYEDHVAACLPRDSATPVSEGCLSRLTEAAELYTDDFLAGFTLPDSPAFDEWQFFQTEGLRQSLDEVLECLVGLHQGRGEVEHAISHARRRVTLDPLHEPAHRELMQLYAWADQRAAALRQYEECVRILAEEFGAPPEEETQELYEAIQMRRLPAAPDRHPAGREVLVATKPQVVSLPLDVTPFVGREEELTRITAMLADPACRLLTIVGLGGIGKTQLAVTAGYRVAEMQPPIFPDGVVFVPLASVENGSAIPSALASALDVSLAGQVDPLTEVSNHLAGKAMLLILDNFEQLVESAEVLTEVLAAGPDLTLLVTSREPLYVSAEWRLDLEGLPYAVSEDECDVETLLTFEAIQLFVQTAQRVRSDFELTDEDVPHVRRLCRLVAGMPLAIKLAATWLRMMPCERIVDEVARDLDILTSRLRDVPARQRSMRVIFENTWELLPADEQRSFASLSVFRGTFTEDAAAEVADVSPWLLAGLVDRGLVQHAGDSRYVVHELTRQFAAEKLAGTDVAVSIRRRHSEYYLQVVASYEGALRGEMPAEAVTALKADLDNIRKAWQWAVKGGAADRVGSAIESLATFYELAGLLQEGQQIFRTAAAALPEEEDAAIVCRLLLKHVLFAVNRGDAASVWEQVERARTLAERTDDALLLADTYTVRGLALRYAGNLEKSIADVQRAVELYDKHEYYQPMIFALNILGESKARLQFSDDALADHRRALHLATDLGDLRGRALSLSYIGGDHYFVDEYKTALSYYEQAIPLFEQAHDPLGNARTVANAGFINCLLGNYDEAQGQIERAIPMLRTVGTQESEAYARDTLGLLYVGRGDYEGARQAFETALTYVLDNEQRLEEGWIRNNLGRLELVMGRFDAAENQFRCALAALEAVEYPRDTAVTHGNLGTLWARRGQMDEALAAYDQAIAELRETRSQYYLSRFLLEKGSLMLDAGKLPAAEPLIVEGRALAGRVGSTLAIFEADLLLARIAYVSGHEDEAVERLQTLLDEASSEAEKAAVHYELWKMGTGRTHARRAFDQYRRLAAQTPDIVYKQRLRELQAAVSA